MPFEKILNVESGTIGIWKLAESSEELIKLCKLSNSDKKKFDGFIAERRRKEFLASRILIERLLGENQHINYDNSGKPALENTTKNISISHSADFACVFISDRNIGIDIEQTTRIIDKVATRFLHIKEQEFISSIENQQEAKLLFWGAKEAIFKCAKNQGIEFNEQIFINPFQLKNEGICTGTLQQFEKIINFKLHYFFFENNVMVYCVEE